MIPEWEKKPYEEKQVGTIFVYGQMAIVTFKDGSKATVAWRPEPFSLVVDIPDHNALYSLDLTKVAETLEEGPGHWTWREDNVALATCSVCGEDCLFDDYPFCPNCGSPMEVQ